MEANLFNHVLIVAEDSSVTYVENYISTVEESNGVFNLVTEVSAARTAKFSTGRYDTIAKNTTVYVNRRGVTDNNARIEWALGMMNDGDTVSDNTTYLMGDGSGRYENSGDRPRRADRELHHQGRSFRQTYRRPYFETRCDERQRHIHFQRDWKN